jgi:RNA 2',3'-cyclic 3'-phosphodiesterase
MACRRGRRRYVSPMLLRLFTALSLPNPIADRLLDMQRGVGGARWRPRDNLHLTLCFYGDAPEPMADDLDSALDEVARDNRSFDLALKGAGFFGKDAPHTLYVGVAESPALKALAADCERAGRRVGLKPDTRRYTPHVTLAYLVGAELGRVVAFEQAHALFESPSWDVEEFGLYSSQIRKAAPSLYRLEAAYSLS